MLQDAVRPNAYIALRLPSDALTVLEIVPNTYVI